MFIIGMSMKVKSMEDGDDAPFSLHTLLKVGIELILEKMESHLPKCTSKKLLMINPHIRSTRFFAYRDIP